MSPQNSEERILGLFLMVVGVSAFGFLSGALSSFFNETDSASAQNEAEIIRIKTIQEEFGLSESLCKEIRSVSNLNQSITKF